MECVTWLTAGMEALSVVVGVRGRVKGWCDPCYTQLSSEVRTWGMGSHSSPLCLVTGSLCILLLIFTCFLLFMLVIKVTLLGLRKLRVLSVQRQTQVPFNQSHEFLGLPTLSCCWACSACKLRLKSHLHSKSEEAKANQGSMASLLLRASDTSTHSMVWVCVHACVCMSTACIVPQFKCA